MNAWSGGGGNTTHRTPVAPNAMSSTTAPNPLAVAWSIMRAQRSRRPQPGGTGTADHAALAPVLDAVASDGVAALPDMRTDLDRYRKQLEAVDPDSLSREHSLAYWLNLYNAGALDVAAEAAVSGAPTVLRVRGGFGRPWATVAGEDLSLAAIEHGKIRRFGDPRIHGALVCGSASCPTLRAVPYTGDAVDTQLDEQLRSFLRRGGALVDRSAGVIRLSRIFLWYGADFVRPHRMPTWRPAGKRRVLRAVTPWLPADIASDVAADTLAPALQPYDWSLACSVG